jgi:hypothetical protein
MRIITHFLHIGRTRVSESQSNINDSIQVSRPGRQSLYVLALLAITIFTASKWSELKVLIGLE